jgi:putative hydrolase of the HAD superfamily
MPDSGLPEGQDVPADNHMGGKSERRGIAAVVFDLGGVVMDSPLHAIARYERDHGLTPNAINRAIVAAGDEGSWSRLERGELSLPDFFPAFEADCRAHGLELSGACVMAYITQAGVARPAMIEAIRRIRARDLRVAALTNNWVTDEVRPGRAELRELFHVFIESSVVGLRKPDPRIYELTCRQLGVAPTRTVFLDDIGGNLKAARALGMTTIKVEDPRVALRELSAVLGFDVMG